MITTLNDKLKESEYYKPHAKEDLITRLANSCLQAIRHQYRL
jgi:hypothetical protein